MPTTLDVSASEADVSQPQTFDGLRPLRLVWLAAAVRVQSSRAKVLKDRGFSRSVVRLCEDPLSDRSWQTAAPWWLLADGYWRLSLLSLLSSIFPGKALRV